MVPSLKNSTGMHPNWKTVRSYSVVLGLCPKAAQHTEGKKCICVPEAVQGLKQSTAQMRSEEEVMRQHTGHKVVT